MNTLEPCYHGTDPQENCRKCERDLKMQDKLVKAEIKLNEIASRIDVYERYTNKREYTDVGDVWDLFYIIRDICREEVKP